MATFFEKKFWLDYFPPPKYLMMESAGVDISDRSVKFAQLSRKKGFLSVQKVLSKNIPVGIIESGEIKDKQKLIDLLKQMREEFGATNIIAAMPEEKAFLSRIKLPLMEESAVRQAIEFQLEEHIPLSPQNAIFDFEIIEEKEDSVTKENHMDVSVIAFPKNIIEGYRDVFESAGFVSVAFEMEVHALERVAIPDNDLESHLIVDFGKTRTTFMVVSNGKIQFTSTIKVAGDDLNNAIIKNLNVTAEKAENIKMVKGFIKDKSNENVFNALLPVVSSIKDEISKHVSYWNANLGDCVKKDGEIKSVILSGGDSNLFGFAEYLSYNLKLPVKKCNPWVNIMSFAQAIPEIEPRESLVYATALGLALRSVKFK